MTSEQRTEGEILYLQSVIKGDVKKERIGIEHLTLGTGPFYGRDGVVELNMSRLMEYDGKGHCKAILFEEEMGRIHRRELLEWAERMDWRVQTFVYPHTVRLYHREYDPTDISWDYHAPNPYYYPYTQQNKTSN